MVGVMVALWLASGAYTVGPDQRGIVLRFGKHVATMDPGFHWHWPYPLETVLRPKVTTARRTPSRWMPARPCPLR